MAPPPRLDERDVKGSNGFVHPVLVIEADIDLAPDGNPIDSSALEDVIGAAKGQFESRLVRFERIRIVPAGNYSV